MKHGRAKNVTIALDVNDEGTRLKISDDGVGIPSVDATSKGMGLHIMRQRAKLIGAHLDVATAPGKGTTVSCCLPFAAVGQKLEVRHA